MSEFVEPVNFEADPITEDEAFEVTWRYIKYIARGDFFDYDQITEHLLKNGATLPAEADEREAMLYQWFDEIQAIEQEQGEPVRLLQLKQDNRPLFALATIQQPKVPTVESTPSPIPPPVTPTQAPLPTPPKTQVESPTETASQSIVFSDEEKQVAQYVLDVFAREGQLQARKTPKQLRREIIDSTKTQTTVTTELVKLVSRKLVNLNLLDQAAMVRGKHTLRFGMSSRLVKQLFRSPEGRELILLHLDVGEPFTEDS